MAAQRLTLRCKSKSGQHTLDNLNGESTVEDLKACLFSITGTDPSCLKVLTGFPPKPLDLENDNCKLDALSLRSGETLIIEEDNRAVRNREVRYPRSDNITGAYPMPTGSPPGILMRRIVPANNSCLFNSVYFTVSGGDYDPSEGSKLRQVIADTVAADQEMYNEAFLGKSNKQYCTWILNEEHWGGGIELSILSKHFKLEIVVVDTQNVRLNRFGEDANYDYRILLIYDGIHYDPLMLEPLNPSQQIQTVFDTSDEMILQMALEIAREAKSSRQFTDVQNFSLRCLVCNTGLQGQTQAQEHAMETGHINFGEV